jgi:hypothetical protein
MNINPELSFDLTENLRVEVSDGLIAAFDSGRNKDAGASLSPKVFKKI